MRVSVLVVFLVLGLVAVISGQFTFARQGWNGVGRNVQRSVPRKAGGAQVQRPAALVTRSGGLASFLPQMDAECSDLSPATRVKLLKFAEVRIC